MKYGFTLFVLFVMAAMITASGMLLWHTSSIASITARATDEQAATHLCVNQPPLISTNCPSSFNQSTRIENNSFACTINAVDPDGVVTSIALTTQPWEGVSFSLTDNQLFMDSRQEGVGGPYGIIMRSYDDSLCVNNYAEHEYAFTVLDINDPPEYVLDIPDVELRMGVSVSRFSLHDHFIDVDGDVMSFTVQGNVLSSITIHQLTGDVIITGLDCGSEFVMFRAIDPGGLSDTSHPVKITVLCLDDSQTGDSGGGRGSGGQPEPPCISKWKCGRWSECFVNGTRYMQCVDLNGCRLNDYLRVFWEECEYETPPEEEERVLVEEEEEEEEEECVDCEVPVETETPGFLEERESKLLLIIMFGVIVLAVLVLLKFFHKQLMSALASLGWFLTRHHRKQLLLSEQEKTRLLKEVSLLDKRLRFHRANPLDFVDPLTELSRTYLSMILDVPVVFEPSEVREGIEKKIAIGSLKKALHSFLEKTLFYETQSLDRLVVLELRVFLEEIRLFVFQTSAVTSHDALHDVSELAVKGTPYQKVLAHVYNAYLALEFEKTDAAKKHYKEVLGLYDYLTPKQKERVFVDLNRLFYEIKYQLSWV